MTHDFECDHGPRAGIIRSGDPNGAYAAADSCGDPACVNAGLRWAASVTGEPAEFVTSSTLALEWRRRL